jgi:hypothetical protein
MVGGTFGVAVAGLSREAYDTASVRGNFCSEDGKNRNDDDTIYPQEDIASIAHRWEDGRQDKTAEAASIVTSIC